MTKLCVVALVACLLCACRPFEPEPTKCYGPAYGDHGTVMYVCVDGSTDTLWIPPQAPRMPPD